MDFLCFNYLLGNFVKCPVTLGSSMSCFVLFIALSGPYLRFMAFWVSYCDTTDNKVFLGWTYRRLWPFFGPYCAHY